MTRNMPWIWFAVLLTAFVLLLTGCGDPSRAARERPTADVDRLSPTEVDSTPAAAPAVNAPAATHQPSPTIAAAPSSGASTADPSPPAPTTRPETRLSQADERNSSAVDRATDGTTEDDEDREPPGELAGRIPTDRFRAIPIEPPASAATAPRETYEEIDLLVPAGTPVEIEFLDDLSSQGNAIGDRFTARVVAAVTVDGYFAIPVGSEIGGEVVDVKRLRKIGGQARLELRFDRLGTSSGAVSPIQASLFDEGRNETRRDAAIIGGSAAAGAVVGRAVRDKKKSKGTLVGALLGAAVGAGIATATEGETIDIPAGTRTRLILERDLQVTVRIRVIAS